MSVIDLIPGIAQAKAIAIGVTSLFVLLAIAYAGYRLHEYDTALTKAQAQVVELTANAQTLKTDLGVCTTTNTANVASLEALRSDSANAKSQIATLAAQKASLLTTTALLAKQIAASKGTAQDGTVAPVLKDTLRSLQ